MNSFADSRRIRVYCRLRPPKGDSNINSFAANTYGLQFAVPDEFKNINDANNCEFPFDRVFSTGYRQGRLFHPFGRNIVRDFIHGTSFLVFTYGSYESGKSYTMCGTFVKPGHLASFGIIPRCLDMIYRSLAGHQCPGGILKPNSSNHFDIDSDEGICKDTSLSADKLSNPECWNTPGSIDTAPTPLTSTNKVYSVFVSVFEIYENVVYDLLENHQSGFAPKTPVNLLEGPDGSLNFADAIEIEAETPRHAFEIHNNGMRHKHYRGHAIFRIRLVQVPKDSATGCILRDPDNMTVSELILADLAGYDGCSPPGSAETCDESLSALRKCLELSRSVYEGRSTASIEDFKLTHIFKNYLKKPECIRMMVCVDPRSEEYSANIDTMKLVESIRGVRRKPSRPLIQKVMNDTGNREQLTQRPCSTSSAPVVKNDLKTENAMLRSHINKQGNIISRLEIEKIELQCQITQLNEMIRRLSSKRNDALSIPFSDGSFENPLDFPSLSTIERHFLEPEYVQELPLTVVIDEDDEAASRKSDSLQNTPRLLNMLSNAEADIFESVDSPTSCVQAESNFDSDETDVTKLNWNCRVSLPRINIENLSSIINANESPNNGEKRSFDNGNELLFAKRFRLSSRKVLCNECGHYYPDARSYGKHLHTAGACSSPNKIICTLCNTVFSSRRNRKDHYTNIHQLIHLNDVPDADINFSEFQENGVNNFDNGLTFSTSRKFITNQDLCRELYNEMDDADDSHAETPSFGALWSHIDGDLSPVLQSEPSSYSASPIQKCNLCIFSTDSLVEFHQHYQTHRKQNNKAVMCYHCAHYYTDHKAYCKHLDPVTGCISADDDTICQLCNTVYTSKKSLKEHQVYIHNLKFKNGQYSIYSTAEFKSRNHYEMNGGMSSNINKNTDLAIKTYCQPVAPLPPSEVLQHSNVDMSTEEPQEEILNDNIFQNDTADYLLSKQNEDGGDLLPAAETSEMQYA